jgi:hypothetical protein
MSVYFDQREAGYAAWKAQIRIIKRGVNPETKLYQGACHNCGTVVEFPRSAAKYQADQRDGDYLEVSCPVCHRRITAGV